VKDDNCFSCREAVGISEVLFIDIVPPHWNGQENAQQTRATQPKKNLKCPEMNWRIEHAFRVEHVERSEQDAHEGCLPGARAHRLNDIIFAGVGG
jgi:hypothetical protein